MFASKLQIRLPRRITAYFLLFGLAALVWLGVAAVYVAHSVTDSRRKARRCVRWDEPAIASCWLICADKSAGFPAAAGGDSRAKRADYCAVLSPTRASIWLTRSSAYKGKSAAEQGNVTDRWGEVVELQFVDDNGVSIHEYRVAA